MKAEFLKSDEFNEILGTRVVIFFEQGFEGTIEQFQAQGYPLVRVLDDFLNPRKVLDSIPHELFNS